MTSDANHDEDALNDVVVIERTPEEAWVHFDADVRRRLGISANEFARRFDAGEYGDPDENGTIMWLALRYSGLRRNGFPR